MQEPTDPGIYHIHVDAAVMPGRLLEESLRLGFYRDRFDGHPEGRVHFAPQDHVTKKFRELRDFRSDWETLVKIAEQTGFVGYFEGEYIPSDEYIAPEDFQCVAPRFRIERRKLTEAERFRQAELHLSMDKDASDQRLIDMLLDSGLYGAYLPKRGRVYIILTAQGYRNQVTPLLKEVRKYMRSAGGAVSCTLKEERIIDYRLFGIGVSELPEVIERVDFIAQ